MEAGSYNVVQFDALIRVSPITPLSSAPEDHCFHRKPVLSCHFAKNCVPPTTMS